MNKIVQTEEERRIKQRTKVYEKTCEEYCHEINVLKERTDYTPEFDYFLDLLACPLQPDQLRKRVGRPLIGLFCIQAPFELFHAFGVHPIKLCSGSYSAQRLSAAYLPVLMCPMLKAYIGSMDFDAAIPSYYDATIVPTTCDWVVKMPEIVKEKIEHLHYLELPHVKQNEKGQKRWVEEIYALKLFLEQKTGNKLKRQELMSSMNAFMNVWRIFDELIELKRKNIISGIWFTAIANTFMFDDIDRWAKKLELVVKKFQSIKPQKNPHKIFLAGSPVIFPNFKMLQLIEQAGMTVCADDLCSSERIFPGATVYDDPSEHGLLKALAERYHKACICPTFADNDRRINTILRITASHNINGIIFHVLKGCHPYDIESFTIEAKLKASGSKFLKIETDYVKEDSQNILTRLEAFKQTLK
ncbi:R-phenyllactate dehydratase beta subunit [Sporomusa ovata DSM 2662]|uniref:2-hydroxyglutaryl-CoA dehydratase (Component D) related protein n=1 Tax=Sporomusa ovata TaxID=2378 RepID=A0A0U1L3Y3_9FIRM|nr:2-hydroxyacyl-CoA dehydratase [Sporomusa ovata]EQB25847.1 benzoyl-CoA reductase/2-hydroxyglutaryl-CoA dehydratase subunit, BcrC/BadD/HgdB [Sporomusa ovata DSM 2662]CQR74411.1 2-hydroxyglutaryl-CoA dehydratase (Component D) related protein [Sporomusa ovata]